MVKRKGKNQKLNSLKTYAAVGRPSSRRISKKYLDKILGLYPTCPLATLVHPVNF